MYGDRAVNLDPHGMPGDSARIGIHAPILNMFNCVGAMRNSSHAVCCGLQQVLLGPHQYYLRECTYLSIYRSFEDAMTECNKYVAEHSVYRIHNLNIGTRYAGVTTTKSNDVSMVRAIEYR